MELYLMPGFRFYPTEEELVSFYLRKKIQGRRQDLSQVIPELYIYEFNPWDLPQFAGERCLKDPEQWFFFVPRQDKEVRGGRPNRLTTSGFWKATGSPGYVFSSDNRMIGAKRTMVFYKGRAPTGLKTEWKMNEYTAIDAESASSSLSATLKLREEFSLCRVYKRSKCLRAFDRRPSSSPSSSSSSSATVMTSAAMNIDQSHDHHNVHHEPAATSYDNHPQNDHPTLVLSSPGDHTNPIVSQTLTLDHCHIDWAGNQSSTGEYANLNSQSLNQGHDFNPVEWVATTYDEHQNDHAMMVRTITTSLDQSSSWHHANPNAQTLACAHDHTNCEMDVNNGEDLCDFWEQLNFL